MIDVQLEQFFPWLQHKYEQKYGERLEQLKSTFLIFYNLTHQIISIYNNILEQCSKLAALDYSAPDHLDPLKVVVNRTIIILHKLVDNDKLLKNKPGAIDMTFCEKFIKNFGENLNILCTYYHSLNHCQIVGNQFKSQKKKIVEGINKLYTIHNKIRELYYKNDENLKNIQNHKLYAIINISHILLERQALFKSTKSMFFTIEDQAADFYACFQEMIQYGKSTPSQESPNLDTDEQAIKKLMKNYFRILHQFSEAQAELEYSLKPILNFCQEIKNKRKSMNYAVADSINIFSRITSQLLKPNYSLKNFKKIRMEDMYKALFTILEDILINNSGLELKDNNEMLGHRIYKQLGLGLLKNQMNAFKNNQKSPHREKDQREREKQKEKEKQKHKNKEKGKQKKAASHIDKDGNSKSSSRLKANENSISKQKQGKQYEKQEQKRQANLKPFEEEDVEKQEQRWFHEQQSETECGQANETPQQRIQSVVDEICECAVFIMDCIKELEKVESSGLLNMIQEYKEKLNVSNPTSTSQSTGVNPGNGQYHCGRKLISKLYEYQKYISNYYKLNENIKQFQKVMREIILQEFRIKVNVVISMEPRNGFKQVDEKRPQISESQ